MSAQASFHNGPSNRLLAAWAMTARSTWCSPVNQFTTPVRSASFWAVTPGMAEDTLIGNLAGLNNNAAVCAVRR